MATMLVRAGFHSIGWMGDTFHRFRAMNGRQPRPQAGVLFSRLWHGDDFSCFVGQGFVEGKRLRVRGNHRRRPGFMLTPEGFWAVPGEYF